MIIKIIFIFSLFYLFFLSFNSYAEQLEEYKIQIKDHQFTPLITEIPANKKVKLIIENLDKTAEEFESVDLSREKIVAGGRVINVMIGPLKEGEYKYFGDFHPKTAQGKIIIRNYRN